MVSCQVLISQTSGIRSVSASILNTEISASVISATCYIGTTLFHTFQAKSFIHFFLKNDTKTCLNPLHPNNIRKRFFCKYFISNKVNLKHTQQSRAECYTSQSHCPIYLDHPYFGQIVKCPTECQADQTVDLLSSSTHGFQLTQPRMSSSRRHTRREGGRCSLPPPLEFGKTYFSGRLLRKQAIFSENRFFLGQNSSAPFPGKNVLFTYAPCQANNTSRCFVWQHIWQAQD